MKKRTKIATTIVALLLAATGVGPAAAEDAFVPGHDDFPNVLRIQDERDVFIPGHTDFPSRLGSGDGRSVAPVVADAGRGFDWADAGVGAMGALTLVLMAGGAAVVLRSRSSARLS